MICTRCYESNVLGSETKPVAKTNLIGVILALSLLGLPGLGYPVLFKISPYSGQLEVNTTSLAVMAILELLVLVSIFVVGRSYVCSVCHHDDLVPRTTVRGKQIQAEASK